MCSYNSPIWRPVKQTRHCWYIYIASLWLNSFHLESTQFTCVFWDFIYLFIFIFLCFPDAYLIVLRSYTIYLNCVFPRFFLIFFGIPFAPWDLSHCTWNLHNFLVFFWNFSYIFCRLEAYLITLEIWISFFLILKKKYLICLHWKIFHILIESYNEFGIVIFHREYKIHGLGRSSA